MKRISSFFLAAIFAGLSLLIAPLAHTAEILGASSSSNVTTPFTSTCNGTVTTNQPCLNLAQTWNGAGVSFTGIKLMIIPSQASAGGSKIIDLATNGGSLFNVSLLGDLSITRHIASNPTGGGNIGLGACGTAPDFNGKDLYGEVITGAGNPTTCTVTFAAAYAIAPICVLVDRDATANLVSYVVSTTGFVFTTTAVSNQHIDYTCFGV